MKHDYAQLRTDIVYRREKSGGPAEYAFFMSDSKGLWRLMEYSENEPPKVVCRNLGTIIGRGDFDGLEPVFSTRYVLGEIEQKLGQKQRVMLNEPDEKKMPYALAFEWLAKAKEAAGL